MKLNNINDLLLCYDDANLLYEENYRAKGTVEIIKTVMDENKTYHYVLDGEVAGWISYRLVNDMSILQALYVKREYHGKQVSKELMDFYNNEILKSAVKYSVLSHLKIALWAEKFYKKVGYKDVLEREITNSEQVIEYINLKKRNYSTILIKKI